MIKDIMDELQFFPLVFNFDITGFDIYLTLVARIDRIYRSLPVQDHTTLGTSIIVHLNPSVHFN
jgi:hypothetical protein